MLKHDAIALASRRTDGEVEGSTAGARQGSPPAARQERRRKGSPANEVARDSAPAGTQVRRPPRRYWLRRRYWASRDRGNQRRSAKTPPFPDSRIDNASNPQHRLNELLKAVVGSDGAVAARTDGLQREITGIGKRRDALAARLTLVESNYRAQFNALDTLLSNLSAQSAALTQQLAGLASLTGRK